MVVAVLVTFNGEGQTFEIVLFLLGSIRMRKYTVVVESTDVTVWLLNVNQSFLVFLITMKIWKKSQRCFGEIIVENIIILLIRL